MCSKMQEKTIAVVILIRLLGDGGLATPRSTEGMGSIAFPDKCSNPSVAPGFCPFLVVVLPVPHGGRSFADRAQA